MNLKKLLASILALAMVLSTMCFTVSAESKPVLGEADFATNDGVVFDGTNYYATLADAVGAVHGIENAILYCKPGANLGTMTHGHVCKNLTVYGNGAYLSGGEYDFEIDYPAASGTSCSGLTGDVTLTVDNLKGAGAWGSRTSEYAVNLIFTNCESMGKVYYVGTTGEVNITMTDCTFTSNDVSHCKVYSTAAGTITLTNVDFSNIDQPVALGNESTGTQNIVLADCDFVNCGAATQDWTVPVSVKSKTAEGSSVLSVDNCSFTGTIPNSIGQDADILFDYGVGKTTATIINTTAKVGVETASNEADYAMVNSEEIALLTNASAEVQAPVARIGNSGYATLQNAIDVAQDDDTITILAGTYNAFEVPADKNNLTFVGETDADGNNLVTIRTMEDDIDTVTKGVHTKAEKLTFRNLDFVSGTVGIPPYNGSDRSWMTSAIGVTNGSVGAPSSGVELQNLTIENCNFTGAGVYNAIWTTKANVTVKDTTITNYEIGIEAYNLQGTKKLEVINSEITNAPNALHTAGDGGIVVVKETKIDESGIALGGASTNVSVTDSEFYNAWFKTYKATAVANISDTLFVNSDVSETAKGTYNGVDIEANYADAMAALGAVNEMIPTKLTVSFEQEEEGLFNIVLSSYDDIYEFVGAELTFQNDSQTVALEKMQYEILGIPGKTDCDTSFEKADTYALRLVADADRMTGNDLVIGQVKFHGRGTIDFKVTEGKVVTTVYGTNQEQYYIADGDETTVDTLLLADSKIDGTVIVKVAYNHLLDGEYWADNQITVTLKDAFGTTTDAMDISDGEEIFENVKLGAVTITLEAPGFRKYVYQTNLESCTEPLVLNFWNDVKGNEKPNGVIIDPAAEIEAGTGVFMTDNFLVGDIIMDYIVDEYDLAAVTSYYGTYNLTDAEKHMKYDLNRDGNIDIMDVAYVLHGYNE